MKLAFPIADFLERAANDEGLLPSHISLFMAIFHYSNEHDPAMVFRVCRRKLMQYSRIRSKATYHKCISELVAFGYITYEPSYDPYRASRVSLVSVEAG